MQVVEQPVLHPGECAILPSGNGPWVDTERVDGLGRRIYVSIEALDELVDAALAGGVGRIAAEKHAIAQANAEVERELERLREVEAEHLRLVDAVGQTLKAGSGAVQGKDGQNRLRVRPGQRAVQV